MLASVGDFADVTGPGIEPKPRAPLVVSSAATQTLIALQYIPHLSTFIQATFGCCKVENVSISN